MTERLEEFMAAPRPIRRLMLVLVPAFCLLISAAATAQEIARPVSWQIWIESQLTLPNIVMLVLLVYHIGMARQEILDFRRRVVALESNQVGRTLCDSQMRNLNDRFDDLKVTLVGLFNEHRETPR
jgi:hypothetical protein